MATMVQAVRMALHVGEAKLGVTDILGEDVGPPLGGVFTATQGLRTAWNTPLDERGIVGAAMGLAMAGQRPVCEIQFCDYAFNTIDLLKLAGNTYWASAGAWNLPLVLMTPVGSGIHGSLYHSHSIDAQATRLPGWKIVLPSNPRDAYGLLLSAIEDPNPVMVLIPKALMRVKAAGPEELIPGEPEDARALSKMIDAPIGSRDDWEPDWPETELARVPIGVARTVREGRDVSLFTYGRMVLVARRAADELAGEGIDVEVIDLRTLHPYDWAAIATSIRKTGRAVFVNEDTEVTNFGEHLIRRATEELWGALISPPILEAGKHVPAIGLADALENASVPGLDSVKDALRRARSGSTLRLDVPRERAHAERFAFSHVEAEPGTGPIARELFFAMERAHRHR